MAFPRPIDPSEASTAAFLSYLRTEAELSDHRAKVLRDQADQLAALYGVQQDLQDRYELGPELAPPLDANGIAKYRGKKRGRKPKERKRKVNPNRKKRAHTAYTLFVHERYPFVKNENPDLQSKEVISIVARLWKEVPIEEKRDWKERAMSSAKSHPSTILAENNDDDDDEVDENVEVDEEDEGDEEDGEEAYSGKDMADLSILVTGGASSAFGNESPVDEDRGEAFHERQSSTRRRQR